MLLYIIVYWFNIIFFVYRHEELFKELFRYNSIENGE